MIALSEQATDRLNHQLRMWREELRIHGAGGTGQSAMTQRQVDRLTASIDGLHKGIERLNQEYRRIVEM